MERPVPASDQRSRRNRRAVLRAVAGHAARRCVSRTAHRLTRRQLQARTASGDGLSRRELLGARRRGARIRTREPRGRRHPPAARRHARHAHRASRRQGRSRQLRAGALGGSRRRADASATARRPHRDRRRARADRGRAENRLGPAREGHLRRVRQLHRCVPRRGHLREAARKRQPAGVGDQEHRGDPRSVARAAHRSTVGEQPRSDGAQLRPSAPWPVAAATSWWSRRNTGS